jgi:hypothetical protein
MRGPVRILTSVGFLLNVLGLCVLPLSTSLLCVDTCAADGGAQATLRTALVLAPILLCYLVASLIAFADRQHARQGQRFAGLLAITIGVLAASTGYLWLVSQQTTSLPVFWQALFPLILFIWALSLFGVSARPARPVIKTPTQ